MAEAAFVPASDAKPDRIKPEQKAESLNTLMSFLNPRKDEIAKVCSKYVTAEGLLKLAGDAYGRNPELRECSVLSIYTALLACAETGLEPGPMKQAAIVAFNNKVRVPDGKGGYSERWEKQAQFIPMYEGLLDLVRRTGELDSIHVGIVREKDEWDYWVDDTGQHLRHRPNDEADTTSPDAIRIFYMRAKLKGSDEPQIERMTKKEVDKVRASSKAKNAGPWSDWYEEQGRKTVFKRGAKWLPKSKELRRAIELDNEAIGLEKDADGKWTAPRPTVNPASGLIPIGAPAALPEAREDDELEAAKIRSQIAIEEARQRKIDEADAAKFQGAK